MKDSRQHEPTAGMTLGDIYYVLFRHKGKIILLSLTGILVAAAVYVLKPPPYQSEAELLIQYVSQARSLSLVGSDQKVIVPDSQGEGVISSEIQILTSLDLAEEVATNIGAAKILAQAGGGDDPIKAAMLIHKNLQADPADKGDGVIVVTFKHPDPQIVQPVLHEIIIDYFEKHHEIHSSVGQYAVALSREGATLREQLNETEQQLARLKSRANIISIDDSRKNLADQIATIQTSILDAQAELAGYEAAMKQEGQSAPVKPDTTNAATTVPPEQLDAYNDLCTRLDLLRKRQDGYLLQGFTRSNVLVLEVRRLMADTLKSKGALEAEYPQIVGLRTIAPTPGAAAGSPEMDLQQQMTRIAALRAKLKSWGVQLDQLQTQATNLNSLAPTIAQLEQTKAIQQANYQTLATKLENYHIDEALDTGKTPNIKWIQMPSPPYQDRKKTEKKVAVLALGGVIAGIGWAFLIELCLDRSVRRPKEILSHLKLPLFLSIPDVSRDGHARLSGTPPRRQLSMNTNAEATAPASASDRPPGEMQVVSLERNPALQPFYEALRDRLVVHFEVRNLTHKPKLVAVTSAHKGAGVSSIAAGLAASLSETRDGNVLLVDMNAAQGSARQFFKGKSCCGLEIALENETKEEALVQENLYVVSGDSKSYELSRILPKRFAALVPKFQASEYDYIIFDMPPVSQTSITSRLARFMDITMLVVESEKTDREVVQQANNWLSESGAKVGAVLNKTRKYVPSSLHGDFNSES